MSARARHRASSEAVADALAHAAARAAWIALGLEPPWGELRFGHAVSD
jgi:hypothetical protein